MPAENPQGQGAYDRLLAEIRDGALPPGTRLREAELSARLGTSRTPVREALRRLESDGLVVHLPRQGATIRSLTHAEMVELYEMRAVLEGTAARLAARGALPVEIDEMEALNSDLARAPDEGAARLLNSQFHRLLADAARNRFLIKAMTTLKKTLLILGRTTLAEPARIEDAVSEHRAVIEALRAGDGARAEAMMRAHVEAALAARIRAARDTEIPLEDEE